MYNVLEPIYPEEFKSLLYIPLESSRDTPSFKVAACMYSGKILNLAVTDTR